MLNLLTRAVRPMRAPIEGITPRHAAIELLREKIAAGEAGLDPYQPSDLIVIAHKDETVWVNRCASLCGVVLLRVPRIDGGERFRFVPEDDVRVELFLDKLDRPWMLDEPLASRYVDQAALLLQEMTEAALARRQRVNEPVSLDAMRTAKAAYDERYPFGVEPQLVLRTDTDGAA